MAVPTGTKKASLVNGFTIFPAVPTLTVLHFNSKPQHRSRGNGGGLEGADLDGAGRKLPAADGDAGSAVELAVSPRSADRIVILDCGLSTEFLTSEVNRSPHLRNQREHRTSV